MQFRINVRPSSIKMSKSYQGIHWDEFIENRKSSTRCKVEHPFLIVKQKFGYCKVVYRGIKKNMNRFNILFASANLLMCIRAGRSRYFVWDNSTLFKGSYPHIFIYWTKKTIYAQNRLNFFHKFTFLSPKEPGIADSFINQPFLV